jgi:tRNA A64-2'-O-ribosylphosphate transferase
VTRELKREQNSLFNCLSSIYHDAAFVNEISVLYPGVPLLANLRCGLWYTPSPTDTCYFKSTDGHTGNWSFSTTRLNWHVAELAAEHGGCIIVDATRKGKRFPVSQGQRPPVVLPACDFIHGVSCPMLLDGSA